MSLDEELSQLGFYQRYKKLFVEYWYVLVPCHGLTSILWFGSLFLLAKSGAIDLVKLLEAFSVPDVIVKPLRNPNLGSLAVAAAMYKVVSPARYLSTVTITVPLIKALVRRGKIKPVPKKGEIKKMMQDQRKIIEDKIQRK
ncbi:hypothetical protein HDE_11737 [Halotydeus destructor]|nr:hypothetical protein HDE_11737 [Halotydeus destructor]